MLHFTTHERTRDTRNLVIHNRTNQLWMLRPVIDGEFWSGPDTITVEPQQSKNYELTYRPHTMTQEGKKHLVRVVPLSLISFLIALQCFALRFQHCMALILIAWEERASIFYWRLKYCFSPFWRRPQASFPESLHFNYLILIFPPQTTTLFTLWRYQVSCTI